MLVFHVGLHKTATTFLQTQVFPNLHGIEYLGSGALDHLLHMKPNGKYLVSNERLAGRLWGDLPHRQACARKLSELFPDAAILITVRRQAQYIESSYKQMLHSGGVLTFSEFFDIDKDSGYMRREQFLFAPIIQTFERCFGRPPFVFTYDEVTSNLDILLSDMAQFIGVEASNASAMRRSVLNKGTGYYAAKVLRWANSIDTKQMRGEGLDYVPSTPGYIPLTNRYTQALKIDPRRVCQHWLSFLPTRSFFSESQKQRVADYYDDDWRTVLQYSQNRNSLISVE